MPNILKCDLLFDNYGKRKQELTENKARDMLFSSDVFEQFIGLWLDCSPIERTVYAVSQLTLLHTIYISHHSRDNYCLEFNKLHTILQYKLVVASLPLRLGMSFQPPQTCIVIKKLILIRRSKLSAAQAYGLTNHFDLLI